MPRLCYPTNDEFLSGVDLDSPENENIDLCRRCWGNRHRFVPPERITDG